MKEEMYRGGFDMEGHGTCYPGATDIGIVEA
jgi:hypothetical protein